VKLMAVHHGAGIGGAPVSLLKLLAALDRDQFQPHAVFTEPGDILSYAADLGVPASVAPTGGAFFYSAHARIEPRMVANFVRTFPAAVQTARGVLRREPPDLLHLNTSVLLAWAAAARRERVPVVWVVREVLGPSPWLRRWHAGFIQRHARRVVAISDAVAGCFPKPVDRVYNAVDLADFRLEKLDDAMSMRKEVGLPPEARVLMLIGSVQRPKGHWLMLEALAQMDPYVELVLVTGGVAPSYARTRRGRLKRALGLPLDNLDALLKDARRLGLARRVHVTGFRRDVARIVAAADVVVFPSLEPEGFGRPIIEAMALARPVVATDVGPSRELLGVGAGRLVPPESGALASALRDVLGSPETRRAMGRAGRARVEACFTLERQVRGMSEIYRRCLSRGH
jgi:glycosyltransferase involved in cell wall biosynthesis